MHYLVLRYIVITYLLNNKEIIGETDGYDRDPLLLAEHGAHTKTEAEGEAKGTSKTCDKKTSQKPITCQSASQ